MIFCACFTHINNIILTGMYIDGEPRVPVGEVQQIWEDIHAVEQWIIINWACLNRL